MVIELSTVKEGQMTINCKIFAVDLPGGKKKIVE